MTRSRNTWRFALCLVLLLALPGGAQATEEVVGRCVLWHRGPPIPKECEVLLDGAGRYSYRVDVHSPLRGEAKVDISIPDGTTVFSSHCRYEEGLFWGRGSCSDSFDFRYFEHSGANGTATGFRMHGTVNLPEGGRLSVEGFYGDGPIVVEVARE